MNNTIVSSPRGFFDSCVLAELFSDGHPPFDLSQLLAYRNNEYDQSANILKDVEDPVVKVRFPCILGLPQKNRFLNEMLFDLGIDQCDDTT